MYEFKLYTYTFLSILMYPIISYHIISHHIISYPFLSHHIISYHIISYHIILYHIIFHYIRKKAYITSMLLCVWLLTSEDIEEVSACVPHCTEDSLKEHHSQGHPSLLYQHKNPCYGSRPKVVKN